MNARGRRHRGVRGLAMNARGRRHRSVRGLAMNARGQRHRSVCPLRCAALLAPRLGAPGAQVVEVGGPALGGGRLGERAPDVDAGVVVAARHAGPAVGVDVHRGRHVELHRPRAVAHLPDREQPRQAAAVLRRERRADGVERVRQGAGDLVGVEVARARLDVVAVGLQPLVVVGGDAVAEDVHGLGLTAEARGQLDRQEDVGAVGDLLGSRDRVVVGDGHEVHPAALGQRVDLLGRRGALGQAEGALDAEPRVLRGQRVDVEVGATRRDGAHGMQNPLQSDRFCEGAANNV